MSYSENSTINWVLLNIWLRSESRTAEEVWAVAKAEALGQARPYILKRLFHRWSKLVRAEKNPAEDAFVVLWASSFEGNPDNRFEG